MFSGRVEPTLSKNQMQQCSCALLLTHGITSQKFAVLIYPEGISNQPHCVVTPKLCSLETWVLQLHFSSTEFITNQVFIG